MTAVLLTGVSIWQMVQTGGLSWVGLFLESATIVLFFANLYRFTTPRTTVRLTNVSAVVFVGAFVSSLGRFQTGYTMNWATSATVVLLVGWGLYVNWATKLERPLYCSRSQSDILTIGI